MKIGQTFSQTIIAQEKDSARILGSGGLDVFGTPAMVAYMENTALKMIQSDLPEGSETVGIEINVQHLKASLIGTEITFTAEVIAINERKISYQIEAKDDSGNIIGKATHDRFIVNSLKFTEKLKK